AITFKHSYEKKALVCSTGGFSIQATTYAKEVHDIKIELWDYEKIKSVAKSCGIYVYSKRKGEARPVYTIQDRPNTTAHNYIRENFVSRLHSFPKNNIEVATISELQTTIIPAIRVNITVKKDFSTSVGLIHRIDYNKEFFYALNGGLPSEANSYWLKSSKSKLPLSPDNPTYHKLFEWNESKFAHDLQLKTADLLTTTVSYHGNNNVSYDKFCEVSPKDVKRSFDYYILKIKKYKITIGFHEHVLEVADDLSRDWIVTEYGGFNFGVVDFFKGKGQICNDCGQIVPYKQSPVICTDCQKSICATHRFIY
ncbi:hypothetical protein, partial [Acidithiobacillus ferrooxidans]|uniref:hypothetical protein n=1 Tax=Acidithiobacillus ferrooxidans TaxID=920 RepID=UPI0018DF7172